MPGAGLFQKYYCNQGIRGKMLDFLASYITEIISFVVGNITGGIALSFVLKKHRGDNISGSAFAGKDSSFNNCTSITIPQEATHENTKANKKR